MRFIDDSIVAYFGPPTGRHNKK